MSGQLFTRPFSCHLVFQNVIKYNADCYTADEGVDKATFIILSELTDKQKHFRTATIFRAAGKKVKKTKLWWQHKSFLHVRVFDRDASTLCLLVFTA